MTNPREPERGGTLRKRLALVHPRYWHVWLLLVPLTFLCAFVPWPLQRFIGNRLGDLTWLLLRSRRRITLRNLSLCFPDRTPAERHAIARESFRNTGVAVFESAMAWWHPPARLAARTRINGMEHLREAEATGRGVLVLGAHYTTLEWIGAAVSCSVNVDIIYRPQNNAAMEAFVHWRRERIYRWQIDRRDVRGIFRALKSGHVVWYTGDQDFGPRQAVFVPFFGVPAATVSAGSRFAGHNRSVVLGIDFRRGPDGTYTVDFSPPLDGFGTGDEITDAGTMTRHIEQGIRKAPGQYMWYHRRFKTRPPGEPSIY